MQEAAVQGGDLAIGRQVAQRIGGGAQDTGFGEHAPPAIDADAEIFAQQETVRARRVDEQIAFDDAAVRQMQGADIALIVTAGFENTRGDLGHTAAVRLGLERGRVGVGVQVVAVAAFGKGVDLRRRQEEAALLGRRSAE